jgi:hypothetical protein
MFNPYENFDVDNSGCFYRVFDGNVFDEELVWHRDRNDRDVYVLEANGWQFQFDNEVPFQLEEGDTLHIKKMDYHRIIKGMGRLVLKIVEKD